MRFRAETSDVVVNALGLAKYGEADIVSLVLWYFLSTGS